MNDKKGKKVDEEVLEIVKQFVNYFELVNQTENEEEKET